jgi:hypothetical protein
MDEVMKLVESGAGFSAIKAACHVIGGNWAIRVYNGQQRGTTNAVPEVVGKYHTHNHGELTSFTVSTAKPGQVIEGEYRCYRVVANQLVAGNAHVPSTMWFVAQAITREEYLQEVQQ